MTRLNYTGRRRIRRRHARIMIESREGSPPSFKAGLELEEYRLPPDASVVIEAYRQTNWMRFSFGTVGRLAEPDDLRLTEFDSADGVLFRVKVTGQGDPHGLILATADRIRPRRPEEQDDNRIPLLAVKAQDIESLWALDFNHAEPMLLINRAAGNKDMIVRSPEFRSLVLPAVLREILIRVVVDLGDIDAEDMEGWKAKWLDFCRRLPGVGNGSLEDEDFEVRCDWVDRVVEAFSRTQNDIEVFLSFWNERSRE